MPLLFAQENQLVKIHQIKGKTEIKKRLNELGFVEGAQVMVIGQSHGNLMVGIQQSRIALSKEVALKIIVGE